MNIQTTTRGIGLAFLIALFATLLLTGTAYADDTGGDGGGGPGGGTGGSGTGTCELKGWNFTTAPGHIKIDGSGAAGDGCGEVSSVESGLKGEGAAGCWNNRTDVVALWYVVDKDSWATTNSGGADKDIQTRAYLERRIDNTPNADVTADVPESRRADYTGPVIKALAKKYISRDNFNTVVCFWLDTDGTPGSGGYQCNYLSDWGDYVVKAGVSGTSEFADAKTARAACYLKCPSASDPDVRTGRAGAYVPAANNTDAKRGAWCFFDEDDFTRDFDQTDQRYLPFFFRTIVQPSDPHAGPTRWDTTNSSAYVETQVYKLIKDCLYKTRNQQTDPALCWPSDAELNAAAAVDAQANHAKLTLNAKNKLYMAEGGVMNVSDFTVYNSVTLVNRTNQKCHRTASFTYTTSAVKRKVWDQSCDPNSAKNANGWVDVNPTYLHKTGWTSEPSTPELKGMFQAVTNHCNSVGYETARTATNARGTAIQQIGNGDNTKLYSGSLVTDLITGPGSVSPANYLLWGAGASNAKGTDGAGYFDKECAFAGARVPGTPAQTMQTAFRDNEYHDFAVDLFKPVPDGVVQDDAGTALTTTVTRWVLGTPQVAQLETQGTFSMRSQANASMFSASNEVAAVPTSGQQAAPVQKNWDTTPFNSRNLSITAGQSSTFKVAANWASKKARPQVFTVKWEYAPTVQNTIPTTVGFGKAGARYYETTVEGARIQGKVNGKFGSALTPAEYNVQQANTGTGSTNRIDVPIYYGSDLDTQYQWKQDPHAFSPYYTAVRFVRASTD